MKETVYNLLDSLAKVVRIEFILILSVIGLIVNILIDAGAIQKQEALGFALERGIGQMIRPLVFRGIVPKHFEPKKGFGYYPQRFCSTH